MTMHLYAELARSQVVKDWDTFMFPNQMRYKPANHS
jgi:hypothetical protein